MITINREAVGAASFEARLLAAACTKALRGSKGGRVGLCLHDPLDVIAAVFALREQGASALLLHAETPEAAAIKLAKEAGCGSLIFGSLHHELRLRLGEAEQAEAAGFQAEEPSLLQYSSGTTGDAKLIWRPWSDIETEIRAYNESLGEDAYCTPVVLAPVSHSYGLICGILSSLERNIAPVLVTSANPKLAFGIVRDTPAHLVYGVPLLLHVLSGFAPADFRFHRLMSSGAPLPGPLLDRLNAMSAGVMQQYGCSEAGCIAIARKLTGPADFGFPLNHMSVTAGESEGKAEEIVTVTGGNKVATGDLGYIGADGRIAFVSRMDDVINVGGLKVFPLEVEERILALSGVKEAVVYRGKHPVLGEIVCALVAPADADNKLTPELVRSWCAASLPPYKVPMNIRLADRIPRGATGKVSRRMLQESED